MCLKLRVSIWRRYTSVRSLQCQTSVSQPLVSADSLHHDLDSTVLSHSFILIRGNINGSTCSQHLSSVNMLKKLIMLFVVTVVLAATFIMIHTQLTQDHTQGTSLTKYKAQLTQDHTQGTSLTKHHTQLTQERTQREHYVPNTSILERTADTSKSH